MSEHETDVLEKEETVKDDPKALAEAATFDEAEFNSYMENPGDEAPTEKDEKGYLEARLEQVKLDYKSLLLQRDEADSTKNEGFKSKVLQALRENYIARRYCVIRLRRMGEKIKDRTVPLSATK